MKVNNRNDEFIYTYMNNKSTFNILFCFFNHLQVILFDFVPSKKLFSKEKIKQKNEPILFINNVLFQMYVT